MSNCEDEVNRHARELVRLTLKAADQGPEPLPEDEVAKLGMVIATERQLLIDAISGLLQNDEPEAAASPGVAEFDAGFMYGLAFARALDEARIALDRVQRQPFFFSATFRFPLRASVFDRAAAGIVPLSRRPGREQTRARTGIRHRTPPHRGSRPLPVHPPGGDRSSHR